MQVSTPRTTRRFRDGGQQLDVAADVVPPSSAVGHVSVHKRRLTQAALADDFLKVQILRRSPWPRAVAVIVLCVAVQDVGGHPCLHAQPVSPLAAAARGARADATATSSEAGIGTALGQAHEQDWIVADILTSLQRLARRSEPPRLRVSTEAGGWSHLVLVDGNAPARLTISGHVWSPDTYAPVVQQLLKASKTPTTNDDLAVRAALVDLRASTILAQDRIVAAHLRDAPRTASAHEAAALVVGAFTLREGLGLFADVRRELSLMTAHLAMAHALRGDQPPGRDGRVALAVHGALVGRQPEALATLPALDTPDATAADRAWMRALRLRITGDWRAPMVAATSTRLEQLEHARALGTRLGSSALLDWLDTFEQDDDPAWHRIALGSLQGMFTLEVSGVYSRVGIDREIKEARAVFASLRNGEVPTESHLLAALDDTAVDAAEGLLPWARWAASAQRHVASAVEAESHDGRLRGDPAHRQQIAADATTRFAGLTLFPLLLRSLAVDATTYGRSMHAARRLVAEHPQLVTATLWNLLEERPAFAAPAEVIAPMTTWLQPLVPTGTAFDLYPRALFPGCRRTPPVELVRAWARAMPYDQWTVWAAQWVPAVGKPPAGAVLDAYGALLDYDANANRLATSHLDLSETQNLDVTQRLCTLSGECSPYAAHLLWAGRETAAAAAYEDWIARARDPLGPANNLEWLARYYVRAGRKADALRVATFAGGTGSSKGLVTLGETLAALGTPEEALAVYTRVAERYGEPMPLATHRLRMALRDGTPEDQRAALTRLWAAFPEGLEMLDLATLSGPPTDGVTFGPLGRRALSAGVRASDIVVGLDEWRVRSWPQYKLALDLRPHEDAVRLTVYRGGRYQQLRLRFPERKLGIGLNTFTGRR